MLGFLASINNLQLDIVGFLAILGEGSVLVNAQVSTLSKFILLPRLLPAPQALIKPTRPDRLSHAVGKAVGAHSGNYKAHVNHIAHLLHDGDALPAYSVRCLRISKDKSMPDVKARTTGPLTGLAILGCAMSVALTVLSIVYDDGAALTGTLMLSFLSTVIGFGSKWSLKLSIRKQRRHVPPGDVVIEYPQGAFLIIKCHEDVARELYWAPEACVYSVGVQAYRFISLFGTLMLMFGVIFLASSTFRMQICFAASYVVLNAAYWTVAALPPQWHWNLSSFKVEEEKYVDGESNDCFTMALWKAIAITQSISWVKIAHVAPTTAAWESWLREAEEAAIQSPCRRSEKSGLMEFPDWDCQKALTYYLNPNSPTKIV
ncbi:hypothetical protein MMC16_007566 [Acarospora aff. strigata]|nr:hypothetical protein [Acarospora aff. strigata]